MQSLVREAYEGSTLKAFFMETILVQNSYYNRGPKVH